MRVEVLYNRGGRAYIVDNAMIFQYPEYYKYADGTNRVTWHALRAYQDEQRKKGEPIRIRGYDEADKWRENHRKADVRPPFFFGSYAENPDLNEYSCDIPYIKHYASDGSDLGFFTNFRWRPGHGPEKQVI
jgi:hypothetical protein